MNNIRSLFSLVTAATAVAALAAGLLLALSAPAPMADGQGQVLLADAAADGN